MNEKICFILLLFVDKTETLQLCDRSRGMCYASRLLCVEGKIRFFRRTSVMIINKNKQILLLLLHMENKGTAKL